MTASQLLARAVVEEGLYAQAFPFFGPERRGAPVLAFTRIDKEPIELVAQVYEPDAVVVLDPTLLKVVQITEGLKPGGAIILNSSRPLEYFAQLYPGHRVAVVDATAIALEKLGANITNTAMLGALVRALGLVPLERVEAVVRDRFNEANVEAVRETYRQTKVSEAPVEVKTF